MADRNVINDPANTGVNSIYIKPELGDEVTTPACVSSDRQRNHRPGVLRGVTNLRRRLGFCPGAVRGRRPINFHLMIRRAAILRINTDNYLVIGAAQEVYTSRTVEESVIAILIAIDNSRPSGITLPDYWSQAIARNPTRSAGTKPILRRHLSIDMVHDPAVAVIDVVEVEA